MVTTDKPLQQYRTVNLEGTEGLQTVGLRKTLCSPSSVCCSKSCGAMQGEYRLCPYRCVGEDNNVESRWMPCGTPGQNQPFVPKDSKDLCHCPAIYHHNQPDRPYCWWFTAASWAYLTIHRDSGHYTGNPVLSYLIWLFQWCYNSLQWKLEKCWRAQPHCRLTELSGWTAVTFRLLFPWPKQI